MMLTVVIVDWCFGTVLTVLVTVLVVNDGVGIDGPTLFCVGLGVH